MSVGLPNIHVQNDTTPNAIVNDVTNQNDSQFLSPEHHMTDYASHMQRSRSYPVFEASGVKRVPLTSYKSLSRNHSPVRSGKPNIYVSRKTKNLVIQMPNGDVYEGKQPGAIFSITSHESPVDLCER